MNRGFWQQFAATALGVLAGVVAAAGTAAVAVAGFTLSYDAIRSVGIASHIRPDWAWLLPVSVDGAMAVATVAAVVLKRLGKSNWYPWCVVAAGAIISVLCNGLHATGDVGVPLVLKSEVQRFCVSAIPPVMLALSVHLLVVLIDAAAQMVSSRSDSDVIALPDESPVFAGGFDDDMPPDPWAYSTPMADDIEALVTAVNEPASATAPTTAPTTATAPTRKPPAVPPRRRMRSVRRPATETASPAEKVRQWHRQMPDATNKELAEAAGVSLRTVERHRPARDTATTSASEADEPPANGHAVPYLVAVTTAKETLE